MMTKIKYIENKKDEKFNIGDFVKVPAGICNIDRIEFGIITGWQGGTYCNVVDLQDGTCHGKFMDLQELVDSLHPVHITDPLVVYPTEKQSDD